MKSYLGLVSKYTKTHRRKTGLTIGCIAISVMLVTAVFGMADMSVKAQKSAVIKSAGNWHLMLRDISEETAAQIGEENAVDVADFLGSLYEAKYGKSEISIQGCGEELAKQMNLSITRGSYPEADDEAAMDEAGLSEFGLSVGESIEIVLPGGTKRNYKITGAFGDFAQLKAKGTHGLQLSGTGFKALPQELCSKLLILKFGDDADIGKETAHIKDSYLLSDEQLKENTTLLALLGESNDTTIRGVYLTAIVLFVLVSLAGIFMIANSFNMSIVERTRFFGMLRCLGATKKQIRKYVRLEGMQYCVKAIPMGLAAGCLLLWLAVFILNKLDSEYMPAIDMFQISLLGIISGVVIGVVVVMIASGSPAKNASKVSPLAAVTGNIGRADNSQFATSANSRLFRVDTAMGLHHAFSAKKSMSLISGSFTLSIVLFLCFSVLISFMNHALGPLKPYAPDLAVTGISGEPVIPATLKHDIEQISGADTVSGRMIFPAICNSVGIDESAATLISYDEPQFLWAKDLLAKGDPEGAQNGGGIVADHACAEEYGWKIGDPVSLTVGEKTQELPIAAIVKSIPHVSKTGECIFACSEQTFTELTGIDDYSIIEIKTKSEIAPDIRALLPADMQLLDYRDKNNEIQNLYLAMAVFVYGFLVVIALVGLFNIANTINTGISGRRNNYGVMRAVGMSGKQLRKVVLTEAAAYTLTGCIAGSILGLALHRFIFGIMITQRWGTTWEPPFAFLAATIAAIVITTLISASIPAKEIAKTDITAVINAA